MARKKNGKLSEERHKAFSEILPLAKSACIEIGNSAAIDGDPGAAAELYDLAVTVTDWLSFAVERKPALFKRIAREEVYWPILYSRRQEDRREADLLMKHLDLGAASGSNVSGEGKSFSWKKPAVRIAYSLVFLMRVVQRHSLLETGNLDNLMPLAQLSAEANRKIDLTVEQQRALDEWGKTGPGSHLPPLSRETVSQWTKAIGVPFRIIFGHNYDRDPRLKNLRESVEKKWGGGLGILRSLMLNAVKQAVKSIAPLK